MDDVHLVVHLSSSSYWVFIHREDDCIDFEMSVVSRDEFCFFTFWMGKGLHRFGRKWGEEKRKKASWLDWRSNVKGNVIFRGLIKGDLYCSFLFTACIYS